ncbi:hypothetical protein [Dendronalium sp. ChiSLP03b]|uniref:hypothetical protein n=1 Tax=Dendronalium sp. ChiSLP03b TaxID=3075381 RepID=UPI002AD2AD89|nr:hypothetical protein [Dendronalium sp. ChiSLP03b]MDZ8207875.1 hypothetical protein [Dendronalium sp. ChiSLP03b]
MARITSRCTITLEFWSEGDRTLKSSKYIPKRLLKRVQQMEQQKAVVREILRVLRITKR